MKITVQLDRKSEKFEALIAFFKALKIDFELPVEKEEKSPYNPEFVKKIKRSQKQFDEGKYITLKSEEDINNLLKI